jgi:hypothetical protein
MSGWIPLKPSPKDVPTTPEWHHQTPTRHPPTEVASPHPPTEVASPHPPTEVAGYGPTVSASLPLSQAELGAQQVTSTGCPADIARHGPGVPVSAAPSQARQTAEQVWRTGRLTQPPRHPPRFRRLAGTALTVILVAASGAVFFSRFHHAPFHVTAVAIAGQTRTGCGVDVTGRITTNGSAGTLSYQWLFGSAQAPQPLSQSVVAGQHAVYVTVTATGQGQGSVSEPVTLQLLGPAQKSATTHVVLGCP